MQSLNYFRKDRSILKQIIAGKPTTWFRYDSTKSNPIPTENLNEAISETAIIPSYIDNREWINTMIPSSDIWLYSIPDICSFGTKRIILIEGFVHEMAHTICMPATYIDGYQLRFRNGRTISGRDCMTNFANLAENHTPISHYAAVYRINGKFYNNLVAIGEELAETIAAYLLHFIYCDEAERRFNPLADRPEVEDFVKEFLSLRKL